ncbi:Macrolide export ATP-binding/permease protein MacB [Micrococcus lylae]|uniref:Macrolide export ATP-binding/permease protein MacB n=1 Tax=Micrococcus lylae TaxID=1273 RepID=A0A1R4I719_9MICC|nr:hypothetical protein HMPREF2863_11080 [Micrococcus sp. HMSC067E09]SJN15588.1 Macrolide export ATP-binding/permease protein MacB [Micrococcus lylae]
MHKAFPGAVRPVLDRVNLTVHAGEFVAIIGPSGSGKSTLLNVLGLLDRPDSGEYRVLGQDTTAMSEAERDRLRSEMFGFVFQSSHVLGEESVSVNAALGLRVQRVPVAERDERAGAALQMLGLSHRLAARAKHLSGGERQRLAIARAVAARPRVVLADEPTGNLDSQNSRLVVDHLRRLHAHGTTILLITHDPTVAAAAARQVQITDGSLTEFATVAAAPSVADDADCSPAQSPQAPARRASALADDTVDAVSSLSTRFLRTLLLMAAFAVGIGGLIAALGLTQTAASQVTARLTAAALDEVVVTVPQSEGLLDPSDRRLAEWTASLAALPHVLEAGHVVQVAPADVTLTRSPEQPEPSAAITLVGASASYTRLAGITPPSEASRALLDDPGARLAWLTPEAARALEIPVPAGGVLSPGYRVHITGQAVDVAGIVTVSERTPQLRTAVLVTPAVLSGIDQADPEIVVRTETGFPYPVAQAAPLAVAPHAPGSVTTRTVADLRDLRTGVTDDLSAFVGVLSAVLLLLAVISAATAMYLSVQARTAEIALRRAIGSPRGLIARLFLLEGTLIGAVGGAVGAAVGSAAVLAVSASRGWTAVLPPTAVPAALALGVAAGIVSALYPAWVASRQRPADALRS